IYVSFRARKEKIFSSPSRRNYRIFALKRKVAEMHLLKDDSAAGGPTNPALVERVAAREFSSELAPGMDHLDQLEAQSIYIFRGALRGRKRCSVLWSVGKSSKWLLWRGGRPFSGRLRSPALHVDTGKNFREMSRFRDHYGKDGALARRVEPCPPIDAVDPTLPP